MEPLINIITRTSNRPNGFKRCVESIKNQTYKNINHIIITDDINSLGYIKKNGYENPILVNREELIKNDTSPKFNTGGYSPHNLYFNEVEINNGWIIYLDDDDLFNRLDAVEIIVNAIKENDEDTLIYWKMVYSNGRSLPKIIDKSHKPFIGGIGGSCMCFHNKYKKLAIWDSWKCSDFRVINRLHHGIPKFVFISKKLILVPIAGFGNKKDF